MDSTVLLWVVIAVIIVVVVLIAVLALVINGNTVNNVTVNTPDRPNAIVNVVEQTTLVSDTGVWDLSPGLRFIGGIPFTTVISLENAPNATTQFIFETTVTATWTNVSQPIGVNNYSVVLEKVINPIPEQDDLYAIVDAGYLFNLRNPDGTLVYVNYYMDSTSSWLGSTGYDEDAPTATATITVYSGDPALAPGSAGGPVVLGTVTAEVVVGPYGEYTPTFRSGPITPAPPLTAYPTIRLVNALFKIREQGWYDSFTFLNITNNNAVISQTTTVVSPVVQENTVDTTVDAVVGLFTTPEVVQPVDIITSISVSIPAGPPQISVDATTNTDSAGSIISSATVDIPADAMRLEIVYDTNHGSQYDDENIVITYAIDINDILVEAMPGPGEADPFLITSTSLVATNPPFTQDYVLLDSSENEVSGDLPDLNFSFGVVRGDSRSSRLRDVFSVRTATSEVLITISNFKLNKLKAMVTAAGQGPTGTLYIVPSPFSFLRGARDADGSLEVLVTNNTQICGSA
jgi:hypothetical protein